MGQRLNIEMYLNGATQATAYYHWSGYTSSALRLTKMILENQEKIQHENATIRAVRLLEVTGAHLTEDEVKEVNRLVPNEDFAIAKSRNDGLIAITNQGIEDTRDWEEGRVEIDLDNQVINFSVIWSDDKENYLEEYEKEEEDYAHMPIVSYAFEAIPFEEFPCLAEDLIAFIEKGQYDVRLKNGDVVSFIE